MIVNIIVASAAAAGDAAGDAAAAAALVGDDVKLQGHGDNELSPLRC